MEKIINIAKSTFPSVDSILEESWRKLEINKKSANKEFGKILVAMDLEATRIFKDYERRALLELAKEWLKSQKDDIRERLEKIVSQKGWDKFVEEASKLFVDFGTLVQSFEKDIGNMRKARGVKPLKKGY